MEDVFIEYVLKYIDEIIYIKYRQINSRFNKYIMNNLKEKLITYQGYIDLSFAKKYPHLIPIKNLDYNSYHKTYYYRMEKKWFYIKSEEFISQNFNDIPKDELNIIIFNRKFSMDFIRKHYDIEKYWMNLLVVYRTKFGYFYNLPDEFMLTKLYDIYNDCKYLQYYWNLSEKVIQAYLDTYENTMDKLERKLLWTNIWTKHKVSEEFILKNRHKYFKWKYVWSNQQVSEKLIETYKHKIRNWNVIWLNQKLNFNFIIKYQNKIKNWNILIQGQKLPESFIRENIKKICPKKNIWQNQKVSLDFINEYFKNSKDLVDIVLNQKITVDFLNKYLPKLGTELIWKNPYLTLDEYKKLK
jgi:hypothetical protein